MILSSLLLLAHARTQIMHFTVFLQTATKKQQMAIVTPCWKWFNMAWRLPNIDQVAQRGWVLTIKLRALGGTIIELSKKQPLFVRCLSIFLSFESLKNLGIPPEKTTFGGS
jgi:hypothetical protein